MNLSLGIVGLPNVGKSTLFNALTKNEVPAENYPFCTIDPNVGIVPVQDERLYKIAELSKPEKTIPAVVEFVDIAGLVKGAAEGQGLGNKFLANIREVSAIIHLVRAFKNPNITHVENSVDPARDIELINTELILKDLDTVKSKIGAVKGRARTDKSFEAQMTFLTGLEEHLNSGKLAIDFPNSSDQDVVELRKSIFMLTDKPVIYLVNTEEENKAENVEMIRKIVGDKTVIGIDIQTEYDLATMNEEDRKAFMEELGVETTGLDLLTKEAYKLLGLISYFTEGPKEVRAWTIKKGSTAPEAAAAIHTDFQAKFITAEVIAYNDFITAGDRIKAKETGKLRLEGKSYVVQDGDVMVFKHG